MTTEFQDFSILRQVDKLGGGKSDVRSKGLLSLQQNAAISQFDWMQHGTITLVHDATQCVPLAGDHIFQGFRQLANVEELMQRPRSNLAIWSKGDTATLARERSMLTGKGISSRDHVANDSETKFIGLKTNLRQMRYLAAKIVNVSDFRKHSSPWVILTKLKVIITSNP